MAGDADEWGDGGKDMIHAGNTVSRYLKGAAVCHANTVSY